MHMRACFVFVFLFVLVLFGIGQVVRRSQLCLCLVLTHHVS